MTEIALSMNYPRWARNLETSIMEEKEKSPNLAAS